METPPNTPDKLLQDPNMTPLIVQAVEENHGVVGLSNEVTTLFLSSMARLAGHSVAVVVLGPTSVGKSRGLVKPVLDALPEKDTLKISQSTPNALYHLEGELDDKVILIEESEGRAKASYPLRIAISEGEVSLLTTQKPPTTGVVQTVKKSVSAKRVTVIETTTELPEDEQDLSRRIVLTMTASPTRVRAILKLKAAEAAGTKNQAQMGLSLVREAVGLLNRVKVVVPFAPILASKLPDNPPAVMRLADSTIALIKGSAALHQRQRPKTKDGHVIAEPKDYEIVHQVFNSQFTDTLMAERLDPKMRRWLDILLEERGTRDFSPSEGKKIVGYTKGDRQWARYLGRMKEAEALVWNGKSGPASQYHVAVGQELPGLPPPSDR